MELIRLDMSEYMESHAISKIIGAPPGYVGFEQGGVLIDAVERNPYSVILLDEIEKAHHEIHNILLQVMDYGCITNNSDKKIYFRNTIIIMTTNAGADALNKKPLGFGRTSEFYNHDNDAAIKKIFSPEFRNRLDAIIQFNSIDNSIMHNIVDKFVQDAINQLHQKKIDLLIHNEVYSHLADIGYNREFGARPLERIISEKIKRPIANEILFGKLKNGGLVTAKMSDGKILLTCGVEDIQ